MAKGGGRIHSDRPAGEVFAFVADAENNPRWRSYVAEIAAWDPPRHVAWRAVAGFATVRIDCTVEPEAGGCRLAIAAEGEFTSRVMRLLSPLAIGVAKR